MSRILVVDDIETNRDVITALLVPLGHETAEAADGLEALARVRDFAPDLVICDILMPTMDGFAFVSALRAEPAIAATRVIFYTAHYHEREAHHLALACGVSEVLTKPVDPESVLQVIARVLGGPGNDGEGARAEAFEREHLRLVTDKLSSKAEELGQAQERLAALVELNLRLASERDPVTLLESVCHGARRLIGARFAAIEVRGKDGTGSFLTSLTGLPAPHAAAMEPPRIQHGTLGRATLESGPRRFAGLDGDAGQLGLPAGLPSFGSALAAPVVSLSDAYGWICLVDKVGAEAFSDDEERLLAILGAHVGRIYENGSLYARVQRHAVRLEEEIRERERAQRRVSLQYEVARVLVGVESFEKAQEDLLQALCTGLGFAVGALWRVDARGQFLRCASAWDDGRAPAEDFLRHTRSLVFSPGAGIPGRAWLASRAIWIDDVMTLRRFPRREAAQAARLRTAAAFPIPVGGKVAGCIEIFAIGTLAREPGLDQLLESLGRQVGLFVERSEQRLRLTRLNRVHATLSAISGAIIRSPDRRRLAEEACRAAVKEADFGAAWIAEVEAGTGRLLVAARAFGESAPEKSAAAGEVIDVLDTRVLHTLRLAFVEDLDQVAHPAPARHGMRSAIALPIRTGGQLTGVLGFLSREPGFFGKEERALLEGLAGEIALALEHIAKDEQLHYLANYDALTGLANRTLLSDRVENALRAAKADDTRVAVIVGDISRFRFVNETFGREAGDDLLRTVARRLSRAWPDPTDTARLSADHFAGVYGGVRDPTDIAQFLRQQLAPAIEEPFVQDGREIGVSFKAGVAVHPEDGVDPETLIKNAEAALARAKSTGERALFYRPEMTARIAETLMLENKLKRALELGQFRLHYQPKVDTVSRRMTGVEALIRWMDDDGRMVSPVKFIGILESTGMILEVGAWVARRAREDRREWQARGLPAPRVAVNVSAIQLRQPEFADDFLAAIGAEGSGEAGIDIELTESLLMHDVEASIAKLAALRERGVGIAIDDFGTGYSSLAYLARLPVNSLKIDRSFVATMGEAPESMTLVATIISLAHAMGLRVTAEGVETQAQADLLETYACDEIQGYLVARPMPAEELLQRLA